MKVDLSKLLEISARTAGAVSVACVALLFFPEKLLPFDITDFRDSNGIWIFIVLVVSISILFSYLIKGFINWIMKKIDKHKTWASYRYILQNLSDGEKVFLKEYYNKRESAVFIDLRNPIHKKLETFKVISMTTGNSLGTISGVPGFIQPWVFEIIDKNPDYLELKQDVCKNRK